MASVVLVKSASNALVVARFQAEALPPLYVASALATGLAAIVASRQERGRARRIPLAGLIAAASLLALLAGASGLRLPGSVTALYLFGEAFATLLSIRFWAAASDLFDARAGRRVFGILGGAGMIGAIAAGLAAQLLGSRIGALGLVPLALGTLGACMGLSAALGRETPAGARPPPAAQIDREARAYLRRDRYPRALAVLMMLLAALTALADFLFRVRAGAELDEPALASLFGALNLWVGVAAVLFQIGLAARILERFGIFRYLLITPGLSAVAAVACLFVPGIAPAFALRLVESSGSLSLNPSAFQLLYGPVPDAIRLRIRSAIDGLAKKVGLAAGGALLMLLGGHTSTEWLVGALVAVVVAIAWALRRSRRHYVRAIERRLVRASGRRPEELRSAEARQMLVRVLAEAEPARPLVALSILAGDPRFDPVPHLAGLLTHPHERVRLAAVRLAGERHVVEAAPLVQRLLADPDAAVQEEAAAVLARLSPDRAYETLAPWIDEDDPDRAAIAIAALRDLEPRAEQAVRERLERPDPPGDHRRANARLIGRLGPSRWSSHLAALLEDELAEVRIAACEAAGATRDPALLEALLQLLGDRAVRVEARRALARYGDVAVPALAELLDDRARPLSLRLQVPRVLRAIGTDAAARALLFSNIQEHAWLRYRIAVNLSRLHEERPAVAVDRVRLREATLRRLAAYRYYLPIYRDLEAGLPPGAPLVRAVGDRLQQNLEVIFRLLQIDLPDAPILSAWRRFAGGDAKERALAIEWLEHLLDDGLRVRLLPLLDRYHRLPEIWGGLQGRPERARDRVREIVTGQDAVLRDIAWLTAIRTWPLDPPLPEDLEEKNVDSIWMERIFSLEGVEIFAGCDVDDLVALAAIAREREFRMGDAIFEEGDESDALYVILEGQVRFEKGSREVFSIGPGASFGESSLLDGAPRPVRARATSPELHVLAIARQDFLELISDRPELLQGIFRVVSRDLRQVLDLSAATEPDARAVGA